MRDLDALLGLQAELEAAGPAGLTPTSATAVAASAEALAEPVPKEWAHLKAAEVVRRQKLVRASMHARHAAVRAAPAARPPPSCPLTPACCPPRRAEQVRRREQLNVRQKDLEVELAAQDRKVAHHTQRLGQLRLQRQQLVEQQRLVSEGIDPEGTALARMAAEQRRQAEDEADRREVVNFALMFWGAFALLCATRGWALDALQGAWMDVTFM